jgi:hypothetical protein
MDAVLMEWFQQKWALNLTVYGPILQRKAEETAMILGNEFRPSDGWIYIFKKHSGLVYKKVCGEANNVNPKVVPWKNTILPHLVAKYFPNDISNAGNCGLFYNMLPDKTHIQSSKLQRHKG